MTALLIIVGACLASCVIVVAWVICDVIRQAAHDAAYRQLREDSLRDLTNDPRLLEAFKITHIGGDTL